VKINAFRMFLPQKTPTLATLAGYNSSTASDDLDPATLPSPSAVLYTALAGQRNQAPDVHNPLKWSEFVDAVGSVQPVPPKAKSSSYVPNSDIRRLKQQMQQNYNSQQPQQKSQKSIRQTLLQSSSSQQPSSPRQQPPSSLPQQNFAEPLFMPPLRASVAGGEVKKRVVITSPRK